MGPSCRQIVQQDAVLIKKLLRVANVCHRISFTENRDRDWLDDILRDFGFRQSGITLVLHPGVAVSAGDRGVFFNGQIGDGDGARAGGIHRDGAGLIVAGDLRLQGIDPSIDDWKAIVAARIKRRGVNIIPVGEGDGPRSDARNHRSLARYNSRRG